MTKKFTAAALFSVLAILTITACKKSETPNYPNATEYYPMKIGKYITYKLDSTNYIGYTSTPTITSYFVKDVVEAEITDNLGRKSYRVVRYIKDSLSELTWRNNNTFMVTPLEKSVEYVENNLRFIRLQNPVTDGFEWPGTSYIGVNGGNPALLFFSGWKYHYENINAPYPVFTTTVNNTITVNQADDTGGFPADPAAYSDRNYGVEVFGKDIGLIYKEFLHWSYQPPSGGVPGYRSGYGVKLGMIDHN